jgi:hypothetical protein
MQVLSSENVSNTVRSTGSNSQRSSVGITYSVSQLSLAAAELESMHDGDAYIIEESDKIRIQ